MAEAWQTATRQPDYLMTDQHVPWCWGRGNEVWAMFDAAIRGDVSDMREIADPSPHLIRCQADYRTPIHFAVRENQLPAVRWLLDQGVGFPVDYHQWHDPALKIATDRGHAEMARLVADHNVNLWGICSAGDELAKAARGNDSDRFKEIVNNHGPQIADRHGNRAIHWAVLTRRTELVDWLLTQGADINSKRPDGARPLDLTNGDYQFRVSRDLHPDAPEDHWAVMDHLLTKGAFYDLTTACRRNDIARVREILANDPEAARRDAEYSTWYSGYPLRSASKAGHLDIVKLLLEYGADPNHAEHGLAPFGGSLYDATQNGHFEVLQLLIESGGNPNQEVESSGSVLSAARDQKTREYLLQNGATHDAFGCCYDGLTDDFEKLCQRDPFTANHCELFAMAAERGHRALVKVFLRYQPDLWNRAPLTLSESKEDRTWIMAQDIDPDNVTWLGIHQLHHGCSDEVFADWLSLDVNLNLIDSEHQSTPLGWAARRGDLEFAKALLDGGADPNAAGEAWAQPMAWASRQNDSAMAKLIETYA